MKHFAWLLTILGLTAGTAAWLALPPRSAAGSENLQTPTPSSVIAAAPSPDPEPPSWQECPTRLELNGGLYQLKAFLHTNRLPSGYGRFAQKTESTLSGDLVLWPPQGHIGARVEWVWLDRGSRSWNGPLNEPPPDCWNLRPEMVGGVLAGGPDWDDKNLRVRVRVRRSGKIFFVRTCTDG